MKLYLTFYAHNTAQLPISIKFYIPLKSITKQIAEVALRYRISIKANEPQPV